MKLINFLRNMIRFMNNRLSELCGYLLFIIMVLLTVNIISREIGLAIPGLSTLSVLILIAVIYLGLSRAEQYNEHASVDMFTSLMGQKKQTVTSIMVKIISIITISVFLYVSFNSMISSYISKEIFPDVVQIPIWPAKLAIVIGLLFYLIQLAIKLYENIVTLTTGKKFEEDEEDNNPSYNL